MTYGESKKITLNLIEEYTKGNNNLTEDEDIATRLYALYNTALQELAQNKKIKSTISYENVDKEDKYIEFELPEDCYQIKRVINLDSKNIPHNAQYYTIGKDKIFIKSQAEGTAIMEYYSYPKLLEEETKDDYELEFDQDVLMILSWAVAGDILKTDPSSDYTAFSSEYQRKLNSLDNRMKTPTVIIKEGVL